MSIPACLVGAGFFGASVYTSLTKLNSSVFANFHNSLTDEQKIIHDVIKKERQTLYIVGLLLGAIVASLYQYFFGGQTLDINRQACIFLVIMMSVTYFYYLLMPKSTYMVYHLTSQDQAYLWNQVHKEMQRSHITGFLVGLAGYALITWGASQFSSPPFIDDLLEDYF